MLMEIHHQRMNDFHVPPPHGTRTVKRRVVHHVVDVHKYLTGVICKGAFCRL